MSYSAPPFVDGASGVLVAGTVTFNVVPFQGAGLAIRVVAIYGGMTRTTGAAITDWVFTSNPGGILVARLNGMSLGGVPLGFFTIPEPGFQLPINAALDVQIVSTVAAGNGNAVVYYYVDDLT